MPARPEVHFPLTSATGTAPLPGGDHFAPRYLIGNIPAGDPAVAQAGAFRYIPDPGDGTGVQTALAEAAVTLGDLWIRPGSWTWTVGPLSIPAGVRVYCAGKGATTFNAPAAGDQGMFILGSQSELHDCTVLVPVGADAGISLAPVIVRGRDTLLRRIGVQIAPSATNVLRSCVRYESAGDPTGTEAGYIEDIQLVSQTQRNTLADPITLLHTATTASPASVEVYGGGVRCEGGDISIRAAADVGVVDLNQCVLNSWKLRGALCSGAASTAPTLRLDDVDMQSDPAPNAAAIGIDIVSDSDNTDLRRIRLVALGTCATGVRFAASTGGLVARPVLDNVAVSGVWTTAYISFVASPTRRIDVVNCRVMMSATGVASIGIDLGVNYRVARVLNNDVFMSTGGAGSIGIRTQANAERTTIEANHVSGLTGTTAIQAGAATTIVSGNEIATAGTGVGIDLTNCNNGMVIGNVIDTGGTPLNGIINAPVTCEVAHNVVI